MMQQGASAEEPLPVAQQKKLTWLKFEFKWNAAASSEGLHWQSILGI